MPTPTGITDLNPGVQGVQPVTSPQVSHFNPSQGYTVVRSISRSGWSGAQYQSSGELSRTQEPSWDVTGTKSDRTADVLADITSRPNVIMPESLYREYQPQLGNAQNITVLPDVKVQEIAVSGQNIADYMLAQKQARQEALKSTFEPSSLTGRENIERGMLATKAQTDWTQSFANLVATNPGMRQKLEQAGALEYRVGGNVFYTQTEAQAYADKLNLEAMQKQSTPPAYQPTGAGSPFKTPAQRDFEQYLSNKPGYRHDVKYGEMQQDPDKELRQYYTFDLMRMGRDISGFGQSSIEKAVGYKPGENPLADYAMGATSAVTGIPGMVGESFLREEKRSPLERAVVATPLGRTATDIAYVAPGLKESWEENPARTAGMLTGGALLGKAAGKFKIRSVEAPESMKITKGLPEGITAEYKIKPSTSKLMEKDILATPGSAKSFIETIRTPRGTAAAAVAGGAAYQGISAEQGRKAQPLVGVTNQPVTNKLSLKVGEKTVVAGTPKFTREAVQEIYKKQFESKQGVEYFQNPTEMKVATENILPGYNELNRQLFKGTMAKRETTFGQAATHKMADVPLESVLVEKHGLKPETAKNVRSYMETQKDLIIWGSTANKALVGTTGKVKFVREVGDIDIHVGEPGKVSQELFGIISKTEPTGKVTMKGSSGLATEKGTLFDIKDIEGGSPDLLGSEAGKGNVFGFPQEPLEKVGKFKTVSLSEQTTAKTAAVGMREKEVSAHAGRKVKDAFDLAFINEPSLTQSMGESLNPLKRAKAAKAESMDIQQKSLWQAKAMREFTPEQRLSFFELVAKSRTPEGVASTPVPTKLYESPGVARGASIEAVRNSFYEAARGYGAKSAGAISQVIPPHSPTVIRTDLNKMQAKELAMNLIKESPAGAYLKGTDVYASGGKVATVEYFNRAKDEMSPDVKFSKGFGSESLTGMNIISGGGRKQPAFGDTSFVGRFYGENPADIPYFNYSDIKPPEPKYPYGSPAKGKISYPGASLRLGRGFTPPHTPPPTKQPGEQKKKRYKSKKQEDFFHTYRGSPIMEATAGMKDLDKALLGTKPKKRSKKKR